MTGSACRSAPVDGATVDLTALSPKECEVLECLSEGLSNRKIAGALRISESTAKWHLKNVYRKLGVHRRAEAVFHFRRERLANRRIVLPAIPAAANVASFACPVAVIRGLASGTSNKMLAEQLFLSRSTIKFHLKKLYRTLGTSNRIEAMQLLRRDPPPTRNDRVTASDADAHADAPRLPNHETRSVETVRLSLES